MQKRENRNNKERFNKEERVDEPIKDEVLQVRRVSTKRAGGSSFHFSVLCIAGDFDGSVGIGMGKSLENTSAIKKAKEKARKNMKSVQVTKSGSIPHELLVNDGSCIIYLKPAPAGAGIIAGGSVRKVLEYAGYKNVSAKIIGSSNQVNNARALVKGLRELRPVNIEVESKIANE